MKKTDLILDCLIYSLPPTVNHVYRNASATRRYKTTEGKQWQGLAISSMFAAKKRLTSYDGKVAVEYIFQAKNKVRWDIDNRIKTVQDCLSPAGVINDDRQIIELTARRTQGNGESTRVRLWILEDGEET